MKDPIPTPIFTSDEELVNFQALFNRPPYDPGAALAKAQSLLPDQQKRDQYWLPLALICSNAGLEWLLESLQRRENEARINKKLGLLSSGEYVLALFALHLFNDVHQLPDDGLTNLRLLDDWHFELAMHAIRIHSRGVK